MNIAVLMGGLLYDSQKSLLEGIKGFAEENDINIFVFTCGGEVYTTSDHNLGEFQIYSLPSFDTYDGIIIAPDTIQNADVVNRLKEMIGRLEVPAIAIDSTMDHIVSFEVDNKQAMYDMTEHAIEVHSKSRLLYISGPKENLESRERENGFLECMEKHGFQEGKEYSIIYGNFWIDSGKKVLEAYLEKHEKPQAIICANDYMAIGAAEELKERGYRIPQDIIVTGFDNSYEGRYHVPRITSVKKPLYEMGYKACEELAEGLLHKGQKKRFKVSYKFSESCGCGFGKKENIKEFKRQMTREKNSNIRWAEIINSMSADLNELNSLSEFVARLKQYVAQMKFPYFYLCLCKESELIGEIKLIDGVYQIPEAGRTGYPEKVQVVIAYEEGSFYEPETIRIERILPERFYKKAKSVVSIIVPIHFRLHCMGYCVVGNSSFPMETIQFQSWIMNLGNGLENIRKQMLMQAMINQLNRMWIYDTMTGVLNRAGFYLKADEVIDKCKKMHRPVLLLFLDIDKLKAVNDSYGHEEGDFYIKSVARACQESCGDSGVVMRYGGDEFVVLCDGHEAEYQRMIQDIHTLVSQVKEAEGKPYPMSVSIGHYTAYIDSEFKLELFVEKADKEMYTLKRCRKD